MPHLHKGHDAADQSDGWWFVDADWEEIVAGVAVSPPAVPALLGRIAPGVPVERDAARPGHDGGRMTTGGATPCPLTRSGGAAAARAVAAVPEVVAVTARPATAGPCRLLRTVVMDEHTAAPGGR